MVFGSVIANCIVHLTSFYKGSSSSSFPTGFFAPDLRAMNGAAYGDSDLVGPLLLGGGVCGVDDDDDEPV